MRTLVYLWSLLAAAPTVEGTLKATTTKRVSKAQQDQAAIKRLGLLGALAPSVSNVFGPSQGCGINNALGNLSSPPLQRLVEQRGRYSKQFPLELARQLATAHRDDLEACGKLATGTVTVTVQTQRGTLRLDTAFDERQVDARLAECLLTRLGSWEFPQPLAAPVTLVFELSPPPPPLNCKGIRPMERLAPRSELWFISSPCRTGRPNTPTSARPKRGRRSSTPR